MAKILSNQTEYSIYDFDTEAEFESAVIANSKQLFGLRSVYIDIKKRVGDKNSYHKGIPDAFLIDYFDPRNPQLYIVENELASHDTYAHLIEQIGRFSVNAVNDNSQIRDILLRAIETTPHIKSELSQLISNSIYSNVTELILDIADRREIKIVIAINDATTDLNLALKIFRNQPDVVVLQRYQAEKDIIYYYEPMREEIETVEHQKSKSASSWDFDTVVCAAYPDGVKEAFFSAKAWWAIRMSQTAREKIKYLAIYEKSPIGHIEHYAEVTKIEPYKDSGKYILYLTNYQKLAKPIPLGKKKGEAPQAPRYTRISLLQTAGNIGQLWE